MKKSEYCVTYEGREGEGREGLHGRVPLGAAAVDLQNGVVGERTATEVQPPELQQSAWISSRGSRFSPST